MATLFGVGYIPKIPGTVASLVTLPAVYCLLKAGLPAYALVCLLTILLAVGICVRAARVLGAADPHEIVLDEVAGQMTACIPLAWMQAPAGRTWALLFVFFALFRLFDITKPGFVDKAQELPGGWGIVMDDIVAGLLAACTGWIVYAAARALTGG